MRRALFVSNGIGEDLIAARIIASLGAADAALGTEGAVTAYPLVGTGAYPPHISLLDPRRALPSGGFSFRAGLRGLGADLAAGIVGLSIQQRRTLARQRGRHSLVVAVGDAYCLWMAGQASSRVAFVSTAESVRIAPFGPLARAVMRRYARRIFARDPDSAEALAAHGLPAVAAGNVIMDLLQTTDERFGLPVETAVVTLLPGSRRDAPRNAAMLARAAEAVTGEIPDVRFLLPLAPTVSADEVARNLGASAARIHVTRAFADAVTRASVIIGLAGTANEQAAGLGRPVVGFPGPGTQFGRAFLSGQHRLLGDALVPARDWRDAAAAVVRLLRDPDERARRGAVGRARMGPPGGAQRIAGALLEMIQNT